MNLRDQVVDRIHALPPLPTAAAEVVRLVRDPNVPGARIARAIEFDPSLTANVLRLANSAYFGFARRVGTVREAILLLGTNRIFQLVFAATVGKMSQEPIRGYDLSAGDLWDHQVGTAIGATRLGKTLNLNPPDYTFTVSLLHDVGKIVLGNYVEANAEAILEVASEQRVTFEEAERHVLGMDHAEIGALVLEHWKLPAFLVEIVRWHHRPLAESERVLVMDLVHVADVMCLMAGVGAGLDALSYRFSNQALARLRVEHRILDRLLFEVLHELMEARKTFNLR